MSFCKYLFKGGVNQRGVG